MRVSERGKGRERPSGREGVTQRVRERERMSDTVECSSGEGSWRERREKEVKALDKMLLSLRWVLLI